MNYALTKAIDNKWTKQPEWFFFSQIIIPLDLNITQDRPNIAIPFFSSLSMQAVVSMLIVPFFFLSVVFWKCHLNPVRQEHNILNSTLRWQSE